jgi:hypothetical protein
MEFSNVHREELVPVQRVQSIAVFICISTIRITFEQHAGA